MSRSIAQVMRRIGLWARSTPFLVGIMLALAVQAGSELQAQPVAAQDLQPRIVVQTGHAAPISAAVWMPDGKFLVTGSSDGQILVWDLAGRIISRTLLGSGGERVVVEQIVVAPDGRSARVEEIQFRDMYDNGVGSEVHRRRYLVIFGTERSEAEITEQLDLPWAGRTGFLAASLKLKNDLIARPIWPTSVQGWRLVRRGGELAMVPPGKEARPIALAGALGPDRDGGDARLEARAQRIEELAQAIDRNAEISAENERNCGLDETRTCAARKPMVVVGALDNGAESLGQRPQLSPDGRRLAWIDPEGSGWSMRVLDLQRATTRSVHFTGTLGSLQYGWRDASRVVGRTPTGAFEVDSESAAVRPEDAPGCLPLRPGELDQPAGGTAAIERCPRDTVIADVRSTVRLTAERGMVRVSDAASGAFICTAFLDQSEITPAAIALASADARLIALQSASGYTALFNVPRQPRGAVAAGGNPRSSSCGRGMPVRADPGRIGFHPVLPLLWVEGRGGRVDFYRTIEIGTGSAGYGLGAPLFTLFRLPAGGFFAIDPAGRYDTNLPPDTDAVRWVLPDQPLQSLAPQTFMRDYYQPGLMRRLMECVAEAADCATRFPPIPSLASLNRVLPSVRIVEVKQGDSPARAIVSVEVKDGFDPTAANGKTRSGVYDVRLFRNNRLVFNYPNQVFQDEALLRQEKDRLFKAGDMAAYNALADAQPDGRRPEYVATEMRRNKAYWRKLSQVRPDPVKGYPILNFQVDLPTAAGTELSEFAAYAFNEDRIKSDTARATFRRAAVAPVKPRAFVVSIGIDGYDAQGIQQLQFAASDAELMAKRLAEIPGYDVRRITLAGKRMDDGKIRPVTREAIELLLSTMSGADVPFGVKVLAEWGFDASGLDHVRPDDTLIISFSGHGWADAEGNFYLLPSDAAWPKGADKPDESTLLSSANLALYLSSKIQAAEIVLIIDACHSAASVSGADFRPGPMGDSGLGQIAFDKGVRIIAATQADDVALEDPNLRQGLLTYALAREGITDQGGKADTDGDGKITLDEWLAYAVKRMPALSSEVRGGRLQAGSSAARGWVRLGAAQAKPAVQEPTLFDFNGKPSGVVLQEGGQ